MESERLKVLEARQAPGAEHSHRQQEHSWGGLWTPLCQGHSPDQGIPPGKGHGADGDSERRSLGTSTTPQELLAALPHPLYP